MGELSERLIAELVDAVRAQLRKEAGDRLRDVYLIGDTKRTDFYLDAQSALEYGLVDAVVAGELPQPKPMPAESRDATPSIESVAAQERPGGADGGAARPGGSAAAPAAAVRPALPT